MVSANGAASRRRGSRGSTRVPLGTATQPSVSPTISKYSFEVPHFRKSLATSTFCELAGMASAQDQNQPVPLSVTCFGAWKKSVTSATESSPGS
jgi:hypothetical protein